MQQTRGLRLEVPGQWDLSTGTPVCAVVLSSPSLIYHSCAVKL